MEAGASEAWIAVTGDGSRGTPGVRKAVCSRWVGLHCWGVQRSGAEQGTVDALELRICKQRRPHRNKGAFVWRESQSPGVDSVAQESTWREKSRGVREALLGRLGGERRA